MLTTEEKISIVQQHLKSLEFTQYNNSISLIELNAVANPDSSAIVSLNIQIANATAQKTALENELSSLQSQLAN
jgi:hypothetical protein